MTETSESNAPQQTDPLALAPLAAAELPDEAFSGRVLTPLGSAVDAAMLRAMQLAVDAWLMPAPEQLPELRASAEAILDPALQRDPRRFFDFADARTQPLSVSSETRRSLDGGSAYAREFVTRYRPFTAAPGPDVAGATAALEDRLLFEHWVHEDEPPLGSVVAVHGYAMGRPRLDAVALFGLQWFRRGLDVALVTLPHHGARTPGDARFSGERFAVPHVARLAEAVRQAIYELRLLTSWLRETSDAPVGLLGLSLGGYLTALMAGLYDDLDFAVPMVPPACMGDLAWRYFMRSRRYREGPPPAFSLAELRAAFRIHSPLTFERHTPAERVLLVAGRGDRIVPPEHPYALWRHWGEPAIHWFSGSHLAPFGRRRIVDAIARHFEAIELL